MFRLNDFSASSFPRLLHVCCINTRSQRCILDDGKLEIDRGGLRSIEFLYPSFSELSSSLSKSLVTTSMRKEAMVGDMEAHITEGVKLLSHLEIVGKSFKVDLKAVFSGSPSLCSSSSLKLPSSFTGRLGVALWTEAIASAADEEEGGVPDEIHHLHEKIQGLWFRPREFEDMVSH